MLYSCLLCYYILSASTVMSGGRTYFYEYQHRHRFLQYPQWVNASHLDDLYSVFGEVFMKKLRDVMAMEEFDDTDKSVRDNVQNYYANFAYTG